MEWFSRKNKNVKYRIKDDKLADFDRAIKRVKIDFSKEAEYVRGVAGTMADADRLLRLASALEAIQCAVDSIEVEQD